MLVYSFLVKLPIDNSLVRRGERWALALLASPQLKSVPRLLADIGYINDFAYEFFFWESIQTDFDRLSPFDFTNIYFIDISSRNHHGHIGQGRHHGIPTRHCGAFSSLAGQIWDWPTHRGLLAIPGWYRAWFVYIEKWPYLAQIVCCGAYRWAQSGSERLWILFWLG